MTTSSGIVQAADALHGAADRCRGGTEPTGDDLKAFASRGVAALFISPEVAAGLAALLHQHAAEHSTYECRWASCGADQVAKAMGFDSHEG